MPVALLDAGSERYVTEFGYTVVRLAGPLFASELTIGLEKSQHCEMAGLGEAQVGTEDALKRRRKH